MSLITTKNGRIMLEDKAYSVLKKVVQVFLPAAGTFYFAMAPIMNLPDATQVVGAIAAFTTFLGVTLHISSTQFNASGAAYDGTVHVTSTPNGSTVGFNVDPSDLVSKDSVRFKVLPPVKSVDDDAKSSIPVQPRATHESPLPPVSKTHPPHHLPSKGS